MDPAILGPIDVIFSPIIEPILLIGAIINLVTRHLAHRSHIRQNEEEKGSLKRFVFHEISNGILIIFSLYYMTLHHHGGMVLSLMVLAMVLADIFEFESRLVESRGGMEIELPKGAMVGSALVVVYILYIIILPAGPLDQFLTLIPI
ncbi:MAG: hypothetical protein MK159_03415 [Halobacteriales archaeon]|nr:hypothetical protein [Halobacteriales archaeon]